MSLAKPKRRSKSRPSLLLKFSEFKDGIGSGICERDLRFLRLFSCDIDFCTEANYRKRPVQDDATVNRSEFTNRLRGDGKPATGAVSRERNQSPVRKRESVRRQYAKCLFLSEVQGEGGHRPTGWSRKSDRPWEGSLRMCCVRGGLIRRSRTHSRQSCEATNRKVIEAWRGLCPQSRRAVAFSPPVCDSPD